MLTRQLRELEEDNLIERKVYPVVPPKVEYKLTEYGKSLIPILKSLVLWGKDYAKAIKFDFNDVAVHCLLFYPVASIGFSSKYYPFALFNLVA